jgi:predicted secreted Zn-dependent protease
MVGSRKLKAAARLTFASAAALAVVLACDVAAAAESSRVVTYPVQGASARAINDDIKTRGPRLAEGIAYAFTAIATKTDEVKRKSGQGCAYKRYRISAVYTFVLPKLGTSKGLPAQTRANWYALVDSLKVHEQVHRTIWRGCFREFEAEITGVTAQDCNALQRRTARNFERKKRSCIERDAALDRDYRNVLLAHPFVREAAAVVPAKSRNLFGKKKK